MGKATRLWNYYKHALIIVLIPLILLPIPLAIGGQESKGAYCLLLMGVYWCTEVFPLGITGLIPVFLVPALGIMGAKDVCMSYMENTTIMMMGGLFVAVAVEKSNLHRRIAIKVLILIGSSPRWLMLGFMLPTWFLSMWISNTATAAMMMPIVEEVIERLEDLEKERRNSVIGSNKDIELQKQEAQGEDKSNGKVKDDQENPESKALMGDVEAAPNQHTSGDTPAALEKFKEAGADKAADTSTDFDELAKALVLSVAFSANAGGTGTLIATPVNIVMQGQSDDLWYSKGFSESPISFASWMVLGMPLACINLIIIWVWLELYFVGPKVFLGIGVKEDEEQAKVIKSIIQREYQALGPMKTDEIQVVCSFVVLVLLWFLRSPDFIEGWKAFFPERYMTDAVPAILLTVVLFGIPTKYTLDPDEDSGPADTLITWKAVSKRYPWDVVLLLGGGFALARTATASGLSNWLGEGLTALENLPAWLLVIILGLVVTGITQFTSNVASASLMIPIAASMAEKMGYNPLYLMLTVALSVQYAFMLPVATPPNAVAFTTGRIKVIDMMKAGCVLNLLCVLTTAVAIHTYIWAFFDLGTIPWAPVNATATTMLMTTSIAP